MDTDEKKISDTQNEEEETTSPETEKSTEGSAFDGDLEDDSPTESGSLEDVVTYPKPTDLP